MHSTACGVGASTTTMTNSTSASLQNADGFKMVHSNDDAMNKIPLKSASGMEDEEKNGGEFIHDTAAAEEARREQMRVNLLKWMKKLTIVLICFIGIALISYVIISLCFSDWPKSSKSSNSLLSDDNSSTTATPILMSPTTSTTDNATSHVDRSGNNVTHSVNRNDVNGDTVTAAPIKLLTITEDRKKTTTTTVAKDVEATATATAAGNRKYNNTKRMEADTSMELLLEDVPVVDASKFESELGVFKEAAVCSDKAVCSQIGSNILQQGGSAVDAAIAALLCNGIATMHSMGIGGGMLMNIYMRSHQHAFSVDAREVAPYAADQEMFNDNVNASLNGGLAIAVPGELMGYHRAHERFGKLPWKTLVEPSIKLCNDGFYLTQHQWDSLQYKKEHLKNNTILTKIFMDASTGEPHPVGTKLKPSQELCATYKLLAENGPLDFYNGTLAHLVAADLKDLGSVITFGDLESYAADLVSSITMQLGDDILYAVPPISSSAVVANIMSILEGFNFTKADLVGAANEATTIHRFVEAMKYGFAKRWELGDLRFNDVRELVSKLTNPEYNMDLRNQINDSSVHKEIYDYGAQFTGVDDVGTAQIVVLAPNGDAVSVTSSVNDYFGAGQAGKRTGILFNSGMNDFSVAGHTNMFGLPSSPSNFIDARKRPMSSMSPMILADPKGDVRLVIGAAGGSKIISAIVEVAARVLWFDQNIKEAIDAPRFHHQLLPNVLQYQDGGFSKEIIKLLESKGHKTDAFKERGSAVCGIVRNATAIYANADYRKQGGVAGF